MIRTIIADDEPMNIKRIEKIIREHCPLLELVGTTDDLTEVQPLIEDLKPALLLLDIEFPPGTVFSLLEKLTFRNFQVIFITAHNTYAAEAFRQNTVDYILKPITKEALVEAVKRVEAKIQQDAIADVSKLIALLKSGWDHSRKISLPSAEEISFVDEADIIRCEASGRYTIIHMGEGKRLTVTKTLKEMEGMLDPRQFFRIHHSHIINLREIVKYHRGNGGTAELTDGSFVDVSSSRKHGLLEFLMNRSDQ